MYTFEDWLNGNIKEKAPGGYLLAYEVDNGLSFLKSQGLINDIEFKKIIEEKRWAYDTALECTLETLKNNFNKRLDRSEDKQEFIRLEKEKIDRILNENPGILQDVIGGHKDFMAVSNIEYIRIKKQYQRYKNGQVTNPSYSLSKRKNENVNYRIKLNYEYKKWLENEIIPQQENKLTIDEIALIYYYTDKQITRKNGDEIAQKYGHKSGEKLYQRYLYYSSRANRLGYDSKQKLKNKIDKFINIINYLPNDQKDKTTDEFKIMKNLYQE